MKNNKLDLNNIPHHIAIIMDGNRRWAKERNLPALKGHQAGTEVLEQVVEECIKLGVKYLTIYALSTENLKERPKQEVFGLFRILQKGYATKIKKLMSNGVRVKILGFKDGLPAQILNIIQEISQSNLSEQKMQLNIAFNYGGRKEIIAAVKKLMEAGVAANKIDEKLISENLLTKDIPDPELVIRTGGKVRMSNFLNWQAAYSEWYFTQLFWPDFDGKQLQQAIYWYQEQQRNFGR